MEKRFYSNGKLLITGEYVVLDGAVAFAIPTQPGQDLYVQFHEKPEIHWNSFDVKGKCWFSAVFSLEDFSFKTETSKSVAKTLSEILQHARILNPEFLSNHQGFRITTHLDFPRDWGLGSSSTLIANIAEWAEIDPYQLLEKTFGGSGYDIASAKNDLPILFRKAENNIKVNPCELQWKFEDRLFFVHLNKKQNSRSGISHYRKFPVKKEVIQRISEISKAIPTVENLSDFETLIKEHEHIISKTIQLPTVQENLFPDYSGVVKSLGAWGGDFVLATGNREKQEYFKEKGYSTQISFNKMFKQNP